MVGTFGERRCAGTNARLRLVRTLRLLVFAWLFLALGVAPTVALSSPAQAEEQADGGDEDGWTAVELGASRVDGLDLAIWAGTIAVAHTPSEGAGGGLAYVSCTSSCQQPESWQRTRLLSDRFVQHVSLAFDRWGHPHLAYRAGRDLAYTTCSRACHERESWQEVTIEQVSSSRRFGNSVAGVSVALDEGGRPRVAYVDEDGDRGEAGGTLDFASCDTGCTDRQEWTVVHLTTPGTANPAQPQLNYVGARPRLAYSEGGSSRAIVYAACEQHCLAPDQWQHTRLPVKVGSARSRFALRFEGHQPRLAAAGGQRASYLECESECTDPVHWSEVAVVDSDTHADHVDLALARGGPRVAYVKDHGGWLHAGNCTEPCTASERWEPTSFPALTGPARIAADGDRLRIASAIHPNDTPGRLKLFLCDAACGDPGQPPATPSGSPAPSTSTRPPQPTAKQPAGPSNEAEAPSSASGDTRVADLSTSSTSPPSPPSSAPPELDEAPIADGYRLEVFPPRSNSGPPHSGTIEDALGGLDPDAIPSLPSDPDTPHLSPEGGSLIGLLVSIAALSVVALRVLGALRVRRDTDGPRER